MGFQSRMTGSPKKDAIYQTRLISGLEKSVELGSSPMGFCGNDQKLHSNDNVLRGSLVKQSLTHTPSALRQMRFVRFNVRERGWYTLPADRRFLDGTLQMGMLTLWLLVVALKDSWKLLSCDSERKALKKCNDKWSCATPSMVLFFHCFQLCKYVSNILNYLVNVRACFYPLRSL